MDKAAEDHAVEFERRGPANGAEPGEKGRESNVAAVTNRGDLIHVTFSANEATETEEIDE